MEIEEFTQEVLAFLESTRQLNHFLDWSEERGFDRSELDRNIEEAQEF